MRPLERTAATNRAAVASPLIHIVVSLFGNLANEIL
jgi:hypothetical protein